MRHQVLLVSDENSGIPRLVRDALALDDISITNASSAKEGMEVFRNIRPRVVLLDFSIPGIQECDMLESRVPRCRDGGDHTDRPLVCQVKAHGNSQRPVIVSANH